jgi:hypothetical protein
VILSARFLISRAIFILIFAFFAADEIDSPFSKKNKKCPFTSLVSVGVLWCHIDEVILSYLQKPDAYRGESRDKNAWTMAGYFLILPSYDIKN